MIKLSRDAWITIGVVALLVVITALAAIQQTQETIAPPLSTSSSTPDGAKALKLWLEALDYTIFDDRLTVFELPDDAEIIFLLEPTLQVTTTEWQIIDNWVDRGGTLIVAGSNFNTRDIFNRYDVDIVSLSFPDDITLSVETPFWTAPVVDPVTPIRAYAGLAVSRDDALTHLNWRTEPALISFPRGEGRIFLSSTPSLFSNQTLRDSNSGQVILNLIASAAEDGPIWFDEWHHGIRAETTEIIGPWNWLRLTPAGRSLLFVTAVVFTTIGLRGWLFGRPVPLQTDMTRRGPLEYITAIANLNRRAGHRKAVLRQYHNQLKRELGRRYRLNPTLPNEIYVAQLQTFNPTLDVDALRRLLANLSKSSVSETEMIQFTAEAADWLEEA